MMSRHKYREKILGKSVQDLAKVVDRPGGSHVADRAPLAPSIFIIVAGRDRDRAFFPEWEALVADGAIVWVGADLGRPGSPR
jgi:hypothetical protein